MKFIAKRTELLETVLFAAKASATKTTLPMFTCLRLDVGLNVVKLTGMSAEWYASANSDCQNDESFATCVPARMLAETLSMARGESIDFSFDGKLATIKVGTLNTRLGTIPETEFPVPKKDDENISLTLPATKLRRAIEQVLWASHKDALARPVLNSLSIGFRDVITFISASGTTGAFAKLPMTGPLPARRILLPSELAKVILVSLHNVNDDVRFVASEKSVRLEFGDRVVNGKLLEMDYPDVERVIPKPENITIAASFPREDLIALLKHSLIYRNEAFSSVGLSLAGNTMTVQSGNGLDSSEETIEFASDKPVNEYKTKVNPEHLISILSALSGDVATMEILDTLAPITFREGGFTALTMPMRLN